QAALGSARVTTAEWSRSPGLVSVTAPAHNEEAVLERFYERVRDALDGYDFELVIVDDGSTDGSGELLDRLAADDDRVRVIHLSRSFGYQAAVAAGIDHVQGDVVVTIDADLPDQPELIPDLIAEWGRGADVVYAVRSERQGEGRLKLVSARWFTRVFTRLAELEIPRDAGDYRLLDKRAVQA